MDAIGRVDAAVDVTLNDVGPNDAPVDTAPDVEPPPPPPPTVTAGTTLLEHDVVDAELSVGLWSVVSISTSPTNALYIYDVGTKQERAVPLPTTPIAVSVDKIGFKAAVAFDAQVAWIDLKAGTLDSMCALSSDAYDLALSSSEVAYVVPRTDQWVSVHAIDMTTCTETTGSTIRAASSIVMHPSQLAAFSADQGLSPSRVHRCDLSPIDCKDSEGSNDWGSYGFCSNAWPSADGTRLYTACGVVLSLPTPVSSAYATYGGKLGESYIKHVVDAPDAGDGGTGLIAVMPRVQDWEDPNADAAVDRQVAIHSAPYFPLTRTVPLSFMSNDAGTRPAHGRFVFTTPTMNALFVIEQNGADDAGDTFAIETILL